MRLRRQTSLDRTIAALVIAEGVAERRRRALATIYQLASTRLPPEMAAPEAVRAYDSGVILPAVRSIASDALESDRVVE